MLQPTFTARDQGFDRVILPVPGEVRNVSLRIKGEEVEGSVESTVDTLVVAMPRRSLRDSVEVMFTARPLNNPTRFLASVANSAQPDNRQEVRPLAVDDDGDGEFDRTDREALFVFLPNTVSGVLSAISLHRVASSRQTATLSTTICALPSIYFAPKSLLSYGSTTWPGTCCGSSPASKERRSG